LCIKYVDASLVIATVGLDSDCIYYAVVLLRPIRTLSWLVIQLSSEPINNSGLQGFCEELGFPYFFFLGKKKMWVVGGDKGQSSSLNYWKIMDFVETRSAS
jgi:hypothetical protein